MNLFTGLLKPRTFKICKVFVRNEHLKWSPNAALDKSIWDRYSCLPTSDCKVQVTYVWIDGTGEGIRAKTKTMNTVPSTHKDCPTWDHDGSSTHLAQTGSSDIYLCPVQIYKDPITKGKNRIVLCETYTDDHKPTKTNHRYSCMEALNKVCEKEVMFGFEQELQLMDVNNRPFGWPMMLGEPAPAGPYYCGVGAAKAFGREIIECLYKCCLYSGVDIAGCNGEVVPAQWEFQTGPTLGIKAADDLWMGRYLLSRIAEDFGVEISLYPKLFPHWNGAGCHANFSTKEMREEGGLNCIQAAIGKLEKKHEDHIKVYDVRGGLDNRKRLTGKYETSDIKKFTSGIGDRSASVRISKRVAESKKGYLEDRRPSSNCDPYQVVKAMVCTCCLDE